MDIHLLSSFQWSIAPSSSAIYALSADDLWFKVVVFQRANEAILIKKFLCNVLFTQSIGLYTDLVNICTVITRTVPLD